MVELRGMGHILYQNHNIFRGNDPPQRWNVFKYEHFTNFKKQKYTLTENAVLGTFYLFFAGRILTFTGDESPKV